MLTNKKKKGLIANNPFFYGGVAQLVERLHGMQKVVGSIPIVSTKFLNRISPTLVRFFVAFTIRKMAKDKQNWAFFRKIFRLFLDLSHTKGDVKTDNSFPKMFQSQFSQKRYAIIVTP